MRSTLTCLTIAFAVASVGAHAQQDTVPFVGCPADGQQGYLEPPHGQPKLVGLRDIPLQAVAYYKGEYSSGVYAPRGWHCRIWYGSSGSTLLVTPTPTDTTHFTPPRVLGPAVEMSVSYGGTSGRFSVAHYGARLFPRVLARFIERVRSEELEPDSVFSPRRYARDSVRFIDTLLAEFTTPAGVDGLGTAWLLAPSRDRIVGIAVITPDTAEPDMSILRVRLGASKRQVEAAILRMNRDCMQRTDGC